MVHGCLGFIVAVCALWHSILGAAGSQSLRSKPFSVARKHSEKHSTQPIRHQAGASNLSALPFYHSSDVIREELRRLAEPGSCPGAQLALRTETEAGASLEVASLSPRTAPNASQAMQRVFLLFGEHARELISPELGLFFLRLLCADTQLEAGEGELQHKAAQLLEGRDRVEYLVVVNANPVSRRRVEKGDWCLRVNERGVDLNRNWGVHRDAVPKSQQTDPEQNEGPEAFSEPETRIIRRLVESFQPITFVSVHSGTFMLGTPAAYTTKFPVSPMPNGVAMLDVLKPINEKHCQCAYGPVGIAVGYESAGTCLDYIYEKLNVPFAFIWEIYTDDHAKGFGHTAAWLDDPQTKQRWAGTPVSLDGLAKEGSLIEISAQRSPQGGLPSVSDIQGKLEKTMERQRTAMTPSECLRMFNPLVAEDYQRTLRSWSGALLELSESINAYLPGNAKHRSEQAARAEAEAQRQSLQQPLQHSLAAIHNRYADLYKKLGLKHHR